MDELPKWNWPTGHYLVHHVQMPGKPDRALAGLLGLVLGLSLVTSLIASLFARGLFADGVYYLYRMAAGQWFHLVEPARNTMQVLRQAPIVLLTRYSDMSMFKRGQAFTFVMLMLPPAICAFCWWRAYAADLQSRLTTSGDAARDTNWRLMSVEWVIPLISIAFAKDGVVTTMINSRPGISFRPMDASRPDRFPALGGIDFSPFRAALSNS